MVRKIDEGNEWEMKDTKKKAVVVEIEIEQKYTDEQVKEFKNEFLENYFTEEVKRYKQPQNGKYVDFIQTATSEESKSAIKGLWKNYKRFFKNDYDEFFAIIVGLVSDVVIQFNPKQFDWDDVNDVGTKANSSLHAYIVKAGRNNVSVIESLLQDYASEMEWKKRVGGDIKELPMTSLDAIIEGDDGEEMYVHETLGEGASLYVQHDNYHAPHFTVYCKQWMDEQRKLRASKKRSNQSKAMLSKEAIEFFDVMKDIYIGPLVSGTDSLGTHVKLMKQRKTDGLKTYTEQNIYWFTKTIRETFTQQYKELFPFGVSFIGMKLLEDKQVLDELIAILNPPEPVTVGKIQKKPKSNQQIDVELSNWICNNLHERVIQDIIHDDLMPADLTNIMAIKIKRKRDKSIEKSTLYDFVNAVEDRLEAIKTTDTTKHDKWFKRDSKPVNEKPESLNSDVKVFRKGELVEVIKSADIKQVEKKYRNKVVMPKGVQIEVN